MTWGWPKVAQRDMLLIGEVPKAQQEPAALGKRTRREAYELVIKIKVERKTSDQSVVTERAYDIADEIEECLWEDFTIGGTVLQAQFSIGQLEEFAGDDVRAAVVTASVLCEARLVKE